jgi:hypothetical protein
MPRHLSPGTLLTNEVWGAGRLVEMVCMNNGLPQVIEVGPAAMAYWERVEEEDE